MTDYKIVSVTTESTDSWGHRAPERIEAHIQVGRAAKLANVELTQREAWQLAEQLLTALRRAEGRAQLEQVWNAS